MPLDPLYSSRFHLIDAISTDQMREGFETGDRAILGPLEAFSADEPWSMPSDIEVGDTSLGDAAVPVRVYRPHEPADRVVVWVHGGGFASGDLDMPEAHIVSAELAHRASATVVSVDYRLARNGVHYPLPIDDVEAALAGVLALPEISAETVVVLGGASAGAALALSTALRRPGLLDLLVLAYPWVHFPVPALSSDLAREMAIVPPAFRFPPEVTEGMVSNYVGRLHSLPVDALPGSAPVAPDHPPTRVLIAEYDDLRPSAELLVTQHREAGVEVDLRLEPGVLHGHLNRTPALAGMNASLDWFAESIRVAAPRGLRRARTSSPAGALG